MRLALHVTQSKHVTRIGVPVELEPGDLTSSGHNLNTVRPLIVVRRNLDGPSCIVRAGVILVAGIVSVYGLNETFVFHLVSRHILHSIFVDIELE